MKVGKEKFFAFSIILALFIFGIFSFANQIELSGSAVFPNLMKKTQSIVQSSAASNLNLIPENIISNVQGYKNTDACKDFKSRQIIDTYQKAIKNKDPDAALNAMTKWQTGLNCLSEKQADDLNKQIAVYIKGLNNKDAASVINPSLNLIDLTQTSFEETELYNEFAKRFSDAKAYNEMKKGFSNAVGLFLPDYENANLERFTQTCKKTKDTIRCNPLFDKLKNFFDKNMRGLGKCSLSDSAKTEFICNKDLVCDPSQFLAGDPKAREALYKSLGLSSPEQLRSTFLETSFSSQQSKILPGYSFMNPNSIMLYGKTAGSVAEKLCEKLGRKKGTLNNEDDSKNGKLEDFLPNVKDSKCKFQDPVDELAKRTATANKNPAALKCFSDPKVDEKNKDIKFSLANKNPDERCFRSYVADTDITKLKIGEKVCKGKFCYSKDKDGVTHITSGDRLSSPENPWADNENVDGEKIDEQIKDAKTRCPEGSCSFNEYGHIIFDSRSGGDTYTFKDTATGQEICVGRCGRDVNPENPKEYDFILKRDKEGSIVWFECRGGNNCLGETTQSQKLEEQKQKALEEQKKEDQEQNKEKEGEKGRSGEENGNPCSASDKRNLARMKCILSTSVYNSQPITLGTQKISPDKSPITEHIIYPNPDNSEKCTTLSANGVLGSINTRMCEELTQKGNPGQDGRGCNFDIPIELKRKPVKAGPDPGPGI